MDLCEFGRCIWGFFDFWNGIWWNLVIVGVMLVDFGVMLWIWENLGGKDRVVKDEEEEEDSINRPRALTGRYQNI